MQTLLNDKADAQRLFLYKINNTKKDMEDQYQKAKNKFDSILSELTITLNQTIEGRKLDELHFKATLGITFYNIYQCICIRLNTDTHTIIR